jgi:hypothetical protein
MNAFSVKAILAGRKTQTRRIIKPQPPAPGVCEFSPAPDIAYYKARLNKWWLVPGDVTESDPSPHTLYEYKCPYGVPGDHLWTKETWRTSRQFDDLSPTQIYEQFGDGAKRHLDYRAAPDPGLFWGRWRASIHLPRWASRITLEVTDVRVEQLHQIWLDHRGTDNQWQDLFAEGIPQVVCQYAPSDQLPTPLSEFIQLWDSINAKRGYSWEANPWVWVVEFKVLS